jgi:hypothetical protein
MLGEGHGGALYSSWPPGSNVSAPSAGSAKQGVSLAVRVSSHPARAPKRRRNGSVAPGPS